ncbi:MAG TPA: hypothetical protein VMI56_05040 [Reyranella sp.]|nr:hypothetical protein [Reyranella sp.]
MAVKRSLWRRLKRAARKNYMTTLAIVALWVGLAFVATNMVANTMQTWTARQHASSEVWVPPPSLREDRSGGYIRTKRPHYGLAGDSDVQDKDQKN